ncbi:MAG TPA: TadE/TadG family type IV pilus assembly protein [Streptosporangiaceae bacterium]|jgi:Flp pilus assembly protein TadG|nr:TadE/TadG family type IV pilus assembly protein [Streptosporangiaceae bacterium]
MRRQSRLWPRLRRDDRGASVVELAVLAPGFLMVIMLIVQFGLWFNARQAALAAAQAGAQKAREYAVLSPGSWQAIAEQASVKYYDDLNTSLLSSLSANAHGSPANQVYVTVSGPMGYSVFNLFGIKWTITETAGGPVECFRPAALPGTCG